MPWLARLAVAWAINAAALWAADALWGSVRIHGWAAYLIATPVFLVVLYFFFESFATLLPANY